MAADATPRWQRVYAIAVCAVVGGALAYALCDWHQWTRLQLDPYRGTLWWSDGPTRTIPINYYGGLLWGAGGALAGAALGALAIRLWRRPLSPALQSLGAAWALTAVILAGAYYHWSLWPF